MAKPSRGHSIEPLLSRAAIAATEAAIAADRAEEEVAKRHVQELNVSGKDAQKFLLQQWVERTVPFIRAIGDGTRMNILGILADREPQEVGALAKGLGVRSSTVSQHLAMLRDARVVLMEKQGVRTLCRLNRGYIAWRLRQIAEKLKSGE